MKIAILGAGFTGLTAALRLAQFGHQVTVFDKEDRVGGMASGFKNPNWDWHLDQTYHHLFTNDQSAISLAKEVGQPLIKAKPVTSVLAYGQILSLDSPVSLLAFPYLSLTEKIKTGFWLVFLRYLSSLNNLSHLKSLPWLKEKMGGKATSLIWEPLFKGKFGPWAKEISLSWFGARIKKRTQSLFYPEGGFQEFAEKVKNKAEKLGVSFILNNNILGINDKQNLRINTFEPLTIRDQEFDKIIVTLPSSVFVKIAKLPPSYIKRLNLISHLNALNLILILEKPFFPDKKTYWLNITDQKFPFLALVEHTNFMDPRHYGGNHILYVGCYLSGNHPYLQKSPSQLLAIFDPYLKRINPNYTPHITRCTLLKNAQPVVTPNYPKLIPTFQTPIPNLYLANMDMIYPWDRGVNYAIELGEKTADEIK